MHLSSISQLHKISSKQIDMFVLNIVMIPTLVFLMYTYDMCEYIYAVKL